MQFINRKILLISMIWLTTGALVLLLPASPDFEDDYRLSKQNIAVNPVNLVHTSLHNQ